ncbi:uncharacterized protein [Nicotiana tomentosiformis]|uniref:uncharacterized protein n=1 Tax=Nicotiana tomentosiformis TaxID=4098 RepID=UPI00388CC0CC
MVTTLTTACLKLDEKKSLKIPITPPIFIVENSIIPLIIAGLRTTGDRSGDTSPLVKLILIALTIQDPSRLGYLKISNFSFLQEHHKKNRKGKWYLDSACSRHMTGDKQLFKTVTKLDGGTITFGDKSKENVIGVGRVSLSSTCDVDEVYLVDELGYNLLSISQLCDNDYEVRFKNMVGLLKTNQFDPKSDEGIILGYSPSSRAYRVFNKRTLSTEKSIHVVFVDTNPHLWNKKLPEDEEIFIVPKSINTGKNTHDEVTDQQDQSTNSPIDNQEPSTIVQTNPVEKEPVSVVSNGWKSELGYPHKYIIGDPHKGMKTIRSLKHTSNIALISMFEPKRVDEALGEKSWITAIKKELDQFEKNKMDVKSAFLNGFISEEVFVKQPPRFVNESFPNHIYKLSKAPYGLKQAPRAWYERLSSFLVEHGFGRDFSNIMKREFEMSMMEELTIFLGLQIKQVQKDIFISKTKYTKELIKKFGMSNARAIGMPMSPSNTLDEDKDGKSVNETMYQGMIGSLLYLIASQPDIMFSICKCARYQLAPKESHLTVVKRIIRYLIGTIDYGLWYERLDVFDLKGFSDADFVGDKIDRKSRSGTCQLLGKSLISWPNKKQSCVDLSTIEAEYLAVGNCCTQVLWIMHQLLDYDLRLNCVPTMCDNTSAICLSKNYVHHSKAKHIEINIILYVIMLLKFFVQHSWPDNFEVSFEEDKSMFSEKTPDIDPKSLKFEHRVLANIIATTLLPRTSSLNTLYLIDMFILYCLVNGKAINWFAWVRQYMLESNKDVSFSANSFPYGLLISHILKVMKVDLSLYAPKTISNTYDKTAFAVMGYTFIEGTWLKKDKAPEFIPHQSTGGIKSEASKSSSSYQLLLIQQNITGIKELLTSMQEHVDKIRAVTKETGAYVARLRVTLQATSRQGIRAIQDVTKKLTKVTKDIDASYDSFCTKGEKKKSTKTGEETNKEELQVRGSTLVKGKEDVVAAAEDEALPSVKLIIPRNAEARSDFHRSPEVVTRKPSLAFPAM